MKNPNYSSSVGPVGGKYGMISGPFDVLPYLKDAIKYATAL